LLSPLFPAPALPRPHLQSPQVELHSGIEVNTHGRSRYSIMNPQKFSETFGDNPDTERKKVRKKERKEKKGRRREALKNPGRMFFDKTPGRCHPWSANPIRPDSSAPLKQLEFHNSCHSDHYYLFFFSRMNSAFRLSAVACRG